MAQNTLMFEVGVDLAKSQFEAIKGQIDTYVGQWQKDLNIKVKIENLDALTNQLKNLGDSQGLRTLRAEIEAINKEFAKLAAGAGGTGTMAIRSLSQSIVEQEQEVKKYERILEQLRTAQSKFSEGSSSYKKYSETIATNETSLNAAKKSLQEFKDRLDNINTAPLKGVGDSAKMTEQALSAMKPMMDGINTSVKTLTESMAKFVSEMQKAGSAPAPKVAEIGMFDAQKFKTLQEAIDKVVQEVNRLATALNGIKFEGLEGLTRVINGLQINANNVSSAFQNMEGKLKFQGTAEEFAAYEKRIQELRNEIAGLEAQAKNTAEAVKKVNNEFKSVSEKAGSETAKNKNISELNFILDNVKKALKGMGAEWKRLIQNDAFDQELKNRIRTLTAYRNHLEKAMSFANISKAGALGSSEFMFNGDIINSKRWKQMYSAKAMKDFAKEVDDVIGRKKTVDDMTAAFERMKQAMLGVGTAGSGGMRGVSANLETINKVGELNIQTLIKEQGHIERLMAIAKQSIAFGERNDVMGMSTQRSQQRANLEYLENVKRMIDYILQNRNQPEWMRFLNTSSSLRIPLPGSGNDIALLGGHYDQLTHSVTTTAQAMRQLKADMTLDSANWNKQWNTDNLTRGLYNVETAIKNIMDAWSKVSATASPEMAKAVAQQVNNLNAIKREITAAMDNTTLLSTRHGYAEAMSANYRIQLKEQQRLVSEINNYAKAQDKASVAAQKNAAAENAARRQATQQIREQAQASVNARKETLQAQAKELQELLSLGSGKLGTTQYDAVRDALRAIREELRQIETMTQRGGLSSGLLMSMGSGRNYAGIISSAQAVVGMREKELSAMTQLTAEEQRFAQAIGRSTDQMRGQSQVLSDLKMMATQYLSVWGAQSFVNKIIETGGLLEQQRLSIGAILGDMEQANTLFGQIQELAIKSPFGVVQLDKMSKQLTAYGFQYKELFDWTKRLADISAATGTEVSRLSLALGHVRAEGALSGYTLRQFAMANVPVLRMLSENLGITTKEVRDRVRKKEISYDDVKDIFMELTNEGGMFYNAQEVMSQALNAKFKNLRDAFDIMYGQIAEGGVGDALKKLAETLTAMAKHWERVGSDILMFAGALGVMKGYTLLSTQAIGGNTIASLKNIKAVIEQENAHLRLARAAGLVTEAEYRQLYVHTAYTASSLKVALVEKEMTIEELQRAVALGHVNKEVATAAVVQAGYNATLISGINVLSWWRKGWFLLGEGIRKAGSAIKSALASFGPMIAMMGVFELFNRASEQNDKASEAAEGAAKATNKYSDLQAMSERVGTAQGKTNTQLQHGIDEMKEALVAVGAYTESLKKQVDSVETLAEKYEVLRQEMKKVSEEAGNKTDRKQALIEEALGIGGGSAWNPLNWFRDNVLQDAKDVDDYNKELSLAFDKNNNVLKEGFEKILKTKKKWKSEYELMSARDIFMSQEEGTQNDILNAMRWGSGASESGATAARSIADVLYGKEEGKLNAQGHYSYTSAIAELRRNRDEISKLIVDAFNVDYPEIDLSKATDEQKIEFDKWLKTTLSNIKDLKEAGQDALHNIIIEGTIKVVPHYQLDNQSFIDFINELKEQNPIAYQEWSRHGVSGTPYSEEEQRKSAEEYKRTFSNSSISSLGNETKKRLKEIKEERKKLIAFQSSIIYQGDPAIQEDNRKSIEKLDAEKKRLLQAQKDYNQYGDPDKNKGEDKNAKAVRERVRVMKEAADAFQYWREKVGDDAAWAHVEQEFGDVLSKIGVTVSNVQDLRGNLQSVLNSKEFAAIKDGKVKTEIQKEVAKDTAQIDRRDWEKESAENLSEMNKQLDDLTRRWEIFNTVREQTGDIEMAQRLAGLMPSEMNMRNSADAAKAMLSATYQGIDFDEVYNLDDKGIEEYVKKLGVSEKQISSVVNALKKWRDLQRDIFKNDLINLSKIIGSTEDYESQIKKIDDNLAKTIEDINASNGSQDDKSKAVGLETARAEFEKEQLTADFQNVFNNAMALSSEAFDTEVRRIEVMLDSLFDKGGISPEKMTEWKKNLSDAMSSFNTAGFLGIKGATGAFLGGGYQGMVDYHRSRRDAALERRNRAKKGSKEYEEADLEYKEEDSFVKSGEKTVDAMNKITKAANLAADGMNLLGDLFASLGASGASTAMSDAGGVLGSMMGGASSLSALGPYGMAAGAALGLASGLFALHDKSIQREIDAIQDQVDALEENTEAIKKARERTLGYDEGELRRRMISMYEKNDSTLYIEAPAAEKFGLENIAMQSEAQKALYSYYGFNTRGTGYSQELENLKEERSKYMEMYNLEMDKKDQSQDALDEYKKKIVELDDQITYYVEDLASELWGIDFKAWSEQISDSLWTAFENGEDAVKAFRNTATDIISQVAQKMANLHIMEPLFADMEKELFGYIDSNGNKVEGAAYNSSTGRFNEDATLRILGTYLGEGGKMEASVEAMKAFYDMAQQISGVKFETDDSSSTGTSIKGITEQTADLLAAYVNAIRADVSVDREMIAQYFPMFFTAITSSNRSLVNIEQHTAAIMRSNDAIMRSNQSILDNLNGLKNKTWKVPMA